MIPLSVAGWVCISPGHWFRNESMFPTTATWFVAGPFLLFADGSWMLLMQINVTSLSMDGRSSDARSL